MTKDERENLIDELEMWADRSECTEPQLAAQAAKELRRAVGIQGAVDDVHLFAVAVPDSTIQDRGDHAPALTRRSMRFRLLDEEFDELSDAIMENDLPEVADAYADMIYIILGSAIMHIGKERFVRVWDEVQRSNMDKLVDGKVIMRDDGKVLKPEGWREPDIEAAFKVPEKDHS